MLQKGCAVAGRPTYVLCSLLADFGVELLQLLCFFLF